MMPGFKNYLPLRVVYSLQNQPQYPQAAVPLEQLEKGLNLYLHALTRSCDRKLIANPPAGLTAGLSLRRHVRSLARQQKQDTFLPAVIQRFPDRELNRDLYFWLTAYMAFDQPLPAPAHPELILPEAMAHLLQGVMTSTRVLKHCPGLTERYQRLSSACLQERKVFNARLKSANSDCQNIELGYRMALGDDVTPGRWLVHALDAARVGLLLPNPPEQLLLNLPYWPVAMWGQPSQAQPEPQVPLVEELLDEEMLQIKPESKKEAEELDLSLYLEAPDNVDGEELSGYYLYPEWNCKTESYRENWCRVIEDEQDCEDWVEPPAALAKLSRKVRRQFEALRTDDRWMRHMNDGEEVDLDKFISAVAQRKGCGYASERLYRHRKRDDRELAVMVLLDVSKSTQTPVGGCRVIDIERQAMIVMAEALAEVGDAFSIYAFSGYGRTQVDCLRVKTFDEEYGDKVRERIFSLIPRGSTRIGAALRHMAERIKKRPERHRLLLLLTDGRPYDPADHYKGLYALEDTRIALQELHKSNIYTYGLTIDQSALEYLPQLFGPGKFTVFNNVLALPEFLPKLYARLTGLN